MRERGLRSKIYNKDGTVDCIFNEEELNEILESFMNKDSFKREYECTRAKGLISSAENYKIKDKT